jgi:hypothetical protein
MPGEVMILRVAVIIFSVLLPEMSEQEEKNTDIYNLTEKEKAAFQEWVDANSQNTSPEQNSAIPLRKNANPSLSENHFNGDYLRLSDGTLWNVRPEDTPISQAWITPVDIIVSNSKDPFYPYKLTNTVSKSSVLARKAETLPQMTPPPSSPQPTTNTL